jgi:hypothetical protein
MSQTGLPLNPLEEIDRKAVDELQRIMHCLQTRRVGIVAAQEALQTLWNAVSGLVPRETMDLITQASAMVRQQLHSRERPDEIAIFVGKWNTSNAGSIAVVKRVGASTFYEVGPVGGTVQGKSEDFAALGEIHPEAAAAKKHLEICNRFGGVESLVRVL